MIRTGVAGKGGGLDATALPEGFLLLGLVGAVQPQGNRAILVHA